MLNEPRTPGTDNQEDVENGWLEDAGRTVNTGRHPGSRDEWRWSMLSPSKNGLTLKKKVNVIDLRCNSN